MNGSQNLRSLQKRKVRAITSESKTHQHFRDGTTVDSILKQYATRGIDANNIGLFQQHTARMPYGIETPLTFDYQGQLNAIVKVNQYFDSLPARLRDKFRHDPAQMLRFMSDPKNKEACQEMGLFEKSITPPAPPAPAPTPPPPVPPK